MPNLLPSTPLFQYNSLPEFIDLLENQSLVLTSLDYKSEVTPAIALIQDVIKQEYPGLPPEQFTISGQSPFQPFFAAFTPDKDLLSKWQKYCPEGGLSVAINTAQVNTAIQDNLAILQCLYDDAAKRQFIKEQIIRVSPGEYAFSLVQDQPTSTLDPRSSMFMPTLHQINRNIRNFVGVLKEVFYSKEQEWRVLSNYLWEQSLGGPNDTDPLPLPFTILSRVVNNVNVSYIKLPLVTGAFQNVQISEVVIGPNSDMTFAKAGCQYLLSKYQPGNSITINESTIPYQ